MVSSKAFVALALAAMAFAAPSNEAKLRRQNEPSEPITCSYVLTPNPPLGDDANLTDREFSLAISRQIATESPSHVAWIFGTLPWVHNADGTYTVEATTATDGLTANQLKVLVTAWPGRGQTLQGRLVPEWKVNSVVCQDSVTEVAQGVKGVKFSLV
ncbi:hypothetical protein PQX77_011351 [Marasmius sp. AFHP31]|nr:hypothetical protein PQX77_011351 [Marasmius sp. AFHP31]